MHRRRLLGLFGAVGLSSVAGCLEGLVESAEFIDRPGEVEGEWTPSQASDPAENLTTHRESAQSLAFLQLAMTGCEEVVDSIDATKLAPLDAAVTAPPIEVATATNRHTALSFKGLLANCKPMSSDHEPYLETPADLVDDTHFEYAYLLTLMTQSPLSLHVDFVGTLPGNLAYIEVSTRPSEVTSAVVLRIGAWIDPEGILVGISDASTEVCSGLYEPTSGLN